MTESSKPPRLVRAATLAMLATPSGLLVWAAAGGGAVPVWAGLGLSLAWLLGPGLYPLLLRLRGRRRPDPPPEPRAWPSVTLLIAAHNEEDVIGEKVENALQLSYRGDLRVVVVSDGSDDGTDAIVAGFAPRGVRLFRNPSRTGKAGALRRALETVESDVVVFSDANAFYEPDAVTWLVRRLGDERAGAATGAVRLLEEGAGDREVELATVERAIWEIESADGGSCVGVDGAMVAARRELVPVYPDGTILDDFVLAVEVVNAGFRVLYEPCARGHERSTPRLRAEYERRARLFAGIVQLYRTGLGLPRAGSGIVPRFLGHKVWRWLAPVAAPLTAAFLALAVGPLRALALLGAGAAALFVLLALRAGPRAAAHKIGFLAVSVLGALAGLLRGLRGRQSGAWRRTERKAPAESPLPL